MEISYDASKHYLGSLCKRGHAWNGLPHSLYRLSDKKCCECERLRSQRYRSSADYKAAKERSREQRAAKDAERYLLKKQDEQWVEKRREYQRQRVARIRAEQSREYRGRLPELQGVILPAGVGKGTTALLSNRGLLQPGMSLEEITILAEQTRFLESVLKNVGRTPTVVQLVEQEQRRYWAENPGVEREHTRKFLADLEWLRYKLSKAKRLYNREKSKRRKAKMKGNVVAHVSAQQIRDRFAEFNGCCAYCGAEGDLHIEHFIPISKGGTHVLGNILPACQPCNYSKRDRDAEQWYRAQPFFTEQRWRRIKSVLGLTATTGQLSFL